MAGIKLCGQTKSGGLVERWAQRKAELQKNPSEELWKKTHDEFLLERLETRYFAPIAAIEECGQNKGEGFSIVTIQCALIEFLAALRRGADSYGSAKRFFVFFFTGVPPGDNGGGNFAGFAGFRGDEDGAKSFFDDVRCGLLHDAQTRNGWRIRASECDVGIDSEKKIVTRNQLTLDLKAYLAQYGEVLKTENLLQEAFCKTFDRIAKNTGREPA